MPTIYIPNAYDAYVEGSVLNESDAIARAFNNARFLWLLNEHDVIILPVKPAEKFVEYICTIKQIAREKIHILSWQQLTAATAVGLLNKKLLAQVISLIKVANDWSIQPCFFNDVIVQFADTIGVPLYKHCRQLVKNNFFQLNNSKAGFRQLSLAHHVPIAEGRICDSLTDFSNALATLSRVADQLIVKQDHNAGGRGNVGISLRDGAEFTGVSNVYPINQNHSRDIAKHIWQSYASERNAKLIVEVYHPNEGVFTIQAIVRESEIALLPPSEIRMQETWIGVETPAHKLSFKDMATLKKTARQFAELFQHVGFRGQFCCDAIKTQQGLLFTEINLRPGSETHAHAVATHLHGEKYYDHITILTRKAMPIKSWSDSYQRMFDAGLLYSKVKKHGVVVLAIDIEHHLQMECFFASNDVVSARRLEQQVLACFEDIR